MVLIPLCLLFRAELFPLLALVCVNELCIDDNGADCGDGERVGDDEIIEMFPLGGDESEADDDRAARFDISLPIAPCELIG